MTCAFFVSELFNQNGGNKMNRELLEKPFDPEKIKQREGSFGKMLDYIEGHSVIQRLNDAFDAEWSFEILEYEIQKDTDEVIVLGKLSAGEVVKTQFGSSRITRARESGEMISLADDLKASATDALKKAATLLGVGLKLYNDGNPTGNQQRSSSNHLDGQNNSRHGGNSGNDGNRSKGNNRISSKQHKYILSIIKDLGMTRSEINQQCARAYGSVLDHISRSDASSLIEELLAQ